MIIRDVDKGVPDERLAYALRRSLPTTAPFRRRRGFKRASVLEIQSCVPSKPYTKTDCFAPQDLLLSDLASASD